jgi:hypothetical protein
MRFMLRKIIAAFGLLTLVAALASMRAYGQEVASLTGVVMDKSGGTISDVAVIAVDTRTGASYSTKTGAEGSYRFAKLPPGPGYTLTASKDGFETFSLSNLYLPVASTTTQNIQLQVGSMTQKVEVRAEGSVSLDTTDTTVGNNFDLRTIQNLPTQFRDTPAGLLRLEPGVISASTNDDQSASRDGAVAGARTDQNNITVDGIDAQEFSIGQPFNQIAPTPVDAIQEFRTEVANPLAENGRGSGAQTFITTKSGTNDWHGSAREYHRNTVTEANDFFNNKSGIPRPALIRNQFGGNLGGPVKKEKLFFFFDYDGRRDASQSSFLQIVPLDHVRNGQLAYINSNPGCGPSSRLQSNPNCVTVLSSAQVAALDPCSNPANATACVGVTPGFDSSLLSFINTRYPHANDLSAGDGVNTGGLRFNEPQPFSENIYLTRIDYNLGNKHKLFTRFNFNSVDSVRNGTPTAWFPGDPFTYPALDRGKAWVIGDTWTINSSLLNQFVYGETRDEIAFPVNFNPVGAVDVGFSWFGGLFAAPFGSPATQARTVPVPTFRDDFSWVHGKHSWQFGASWKPIKTREKLVGDFPFPALGLSSSVPQLDSSVRPADILQDPNAIAVGQWDSAFAGFLGAYSASNANFTYLKDGTANAHGTGARRDYRYYFYEGYAEDSWKLRPDLTFTYGLHYSYASVPYEVNGNEAVTGTGIDQVLGTRVADGLKGISGNDVIPFLTYHLAGKANANAPSMYEGDKLNFSPRLGMAWNPSFRSNLLGSVFGDRKTVLRAGFGLIYDQTATSSIVFLQDQSNYLFSNRAGTSFAATNATDFLVNAPRFSSITSVPDSPAAPPFQNPLTPFTQNVGGQLVGTGVGVGSFNYTVDPHFKTPYSMTVSAGFQRELPGNFQLEVDYYGRLGRRLLSLADGGQTVDFIDPASKQGMVAALSALELAARNGTAPGGLAVQPFFENQGAIGLGAPCASAFGVSCTEIIYANNLSNLQTGSLGNVVDFMSFFSLVPPGVGISPQFVVNAYITNKSYSAYHSLFTVLRKRLSRSFQMDFNYTFSHSIDNTSLTANNNGNQPAAAIVFVCDATNLRVCRGNSEFDVTHQISANGVYDLPFGKGRWIGGNANRALDEVIGGWQLSGILSWRSGLAFPAQSGNDTVSLAVDAGAIYDGNRSALASRIHTDTANNNVIQFYANPTVAAGAFSNVTGLQIGNRDTLRGPHFSNVDLGIAKNFPLFGEKYKLQFRTDAFNVFNHPNFSLPNTDINSSNFGVITTTSGAARVLQFALRLDF